MSAGEGSPSAKTYVVEHLDPELGPWSALEYRCIAEECRRAGARCYLSSISDDLDVPDELKALAGLELHTASVEELFADDKARVCLLDPAAADELTPGDGQRFDVFLFGGILGTYVRGPFHWRSVWCRAYQVNG